MNMLTYQKIAVQKRHALMAYLLIGDAEEAMVQRYLSYGQLWLLQDNGQTVGALHYVPAGANRIEIKNLGILPEYRRHGYGRQAIELLTEQLSNQDYQQLVVGTGDASFEAIAFYMHQGFRFSDIRPRFFDQYQTPIVENGIQLQEMLVLTKALIWNLVCQRTRQ